MPIVGAVAHLDPDPTRSAQVLSYLRDLAEVTVGELQVGGLPLVLDCATREAEKQLWEELSNLSGVLFLSVVYADFSDIVGECHDHAST